MNCIPLNVDNVFILNPTLFEGPMIIATGVNLNVAGLRKTFLNAFGRDQKGFWILVPAQMCNHNLVFSERKSEFSVSKSVLLKEGNLIFIGQSLGRGNQGSRRFPSQIMLQSVQGFRGGLQCSFSIENSDFSLGFLNRSDVGNRKELPVIPPN